MRRPAACGDFWNEPAFLDCRLLLFAHARPNEAEDSGCQRALAGLFVDYSVKLQ